MWLVTLMDSSDYCSKPSYTLVTVLSMIQLQSADLPTSHRHSEGLSHWYRLNTETHFYIKSRNVIYKNQSIYSLANVPLLHQSMARSIFLRRLQNHRILEAPYFGQHWTVWHVWPRIRDKHRWNPTPSQGCGHSCHHLRTWRHLTMDAEFSCAPYMCPQFHIQTLKGAS